MKSGRSQDDHYRILPGVNYMETSNRNLQSARNGKNNEQKSNECTFLRRVTCGNFSKFINNFFHFSQMVVLDPFLYYHVPRSIPGKTGLNNHHETEHFNGDKRFGNHTA
jgi:hypothetical protein